MSRIRCSATNRPGLRACCTEATPKLRRQGAPTAAWRACLSLERGGQVRTLARAKSHRDAQALEVLVDDLAAQAHAMRLEEIVHLALAIEQRNYRLAHPRQRRIGKL